MVGRIEMADRRTEGAVVAGKQQSISMKPVTGSTKIRVADASRHRRPAEVHREEQDHHQPPPEDRHRGAGDAIRPSARSRTPSRAAPPRCTPSGMPSSTANSMAQTDSSTVAGNSCQELLPDRILRDDGAAEIAAAAPALIVQELLPQRLVEAEFVAQLGASRSGAMPRSPHATSIGSPGTRWISMKLRNVTADEGRDDHADAREQEAQHGESATAVRSPAPACAVTYFRSTASNWWRPNGLIL